MCVGQRAGGHGRITEYAGHIIHQSTWHTDTVGSGRVGSDDLGYGPGSGFSLKPVQTSNRDNGENIFFLNNCLN